MDSNRYHRLHPKVLLCLLLVKDAIMCHNTQYTRNIEAMFDAVSFEVVKMMVESSDDN